MLRSARFSVNVSNLCKSRTIKADWQLCRVRFAHELKNSKTYVIKIHGDSPKGQSAARRCIPKPADGSVHPKLTREQQFDNAVRMVMRTQIQSKDFIDRLQFDKHLATLSKVKDQQVLAFNEKVVPIVKENVANGRANFTKYFIAVKQSEAYSRSSKVPAQAYQISRIVAQHAQRNWTVFMESEMRMRIQGFVIRLYHTVKSNVIKVFQFIYECYFQKPTATSKKH